MQRACARPAFRIEMGPSGVLVVGTLGG